MEEQKIHIQEEKIIEAAQHSEDAFIDLFINSFKKLAGEHLSGEAFTKLNPSQITLWGFMILHDEIMDGGFIQLIYNGYGPFIFDNPFAKALRLWGLKDLSKLIYKAKTFYDKEKNNLTQEINDEEFMALYEQYDFFDDLDDEFISNEESYITDIALYIDKHIEEFACIDKA